MKRSLFYMLPALILAGCAQDFDLAETTATGPPQTEATSEPATRSLDGAIYNEVTGNWMIGLADPFALANVQVAYDRLAAGLSAQSLSKSEAAEFAAGKKLAPTHYALKIYPRTEEEQSRVETMRDVNVAYMPFVYSQLTQEETARIERRGLARSAANTFAERSPYTVTHNYTDVTDGGPTGPVTYQLPILYTVWPASKPLPADLEYTVDYPVYLPEYPEAQAGKTTSLHSTSSSDVKIHLFREAVALSRGEEAAPASDKNATRAGGPPNSNMWGTVSGTLENYDSVAQCDAPLANLSIGFQYGSLGSTTGSTDNNGYYEVMIPNPSLFGNNDTWTLTVTYRDPQNRWKIVPSGFVPYSITFSGYASSFINGGTAPTCLISSARQENEIQRAVSYLFNVQNSFPPLYNTSGGTIIEALSSSNNEYDGFFSSGSTHPRIQIYNNGRSCSVNIGTTLHELGHSIHYAYHYSRNNLSAYTGTIPFLKEAFANYVGWYLGEAYYRSLGWIKSDPRTDITGYQYQSWNVLNINVYSPLFIDLTDDLNQRGGALAPNDDIENVPPSVIWDVIKACQTWPQCRDIMENYVGTYYTSTEFDNYIYIYALWVSRNL